jgi:hypothetical protein
MGMNGINLIPAPRLAARRRRAHLRYCAMGCAGWAIMLLAMAAAAHAIWHEEDPQAAERLAKVTDEMQRTERVTTGLRAQLAAAQSTLRANQAIVSQPDWSILLGLLGQQVGNDVVLKGCRVRVGVPSRGNAPAPAARADARRPGARQAPSAQPEAPASQPPEPTFILETSGMALDHAAANRFLLRLEQTGLFSKVSLLDTSREPFFDKNAIAFRLECALNPAPPQDAPAAGATARGGE